MCAEIVSVVNFYEGKSILITGATGGIGKLLVEKLLRSCPNIKKLYLLLRPKKGKNATERLTDLFNAPIFDKLREYNPGAFSKVLLVEGDLCLNNLNLSDDDRETLMSNVSIVFHCAAVLKFDATVEDAVSHNVLTTRRLLHLCHQMSNIEAFIHVSTLYSTCNNKVIEERVPSIPALDEIIDFNKDDEDFLKTTPFDVAKEWPNTYTFSKALGEMMLSNLKGKFPISIVRPSVVLSTIKEPLPGWLENFYGPTILLANAALGLIRAIVCIGDRVFDVIPSDLVVNLMICVGCKTAYEKTNDVKVYNCCSGAQNPAETISLLNDCITPFTIYPLKNAVRYPSLRCHSSRFTHYIDCLIEHKLFFYILDFISICKLKKPRMIRIYGSLSRILESLAHFAVTEWMVDDDNVLNLYNQLSEKEKEIFYFDVKAINWKVFARTYALGIRKYLLKEDMKSVENAVVRINKLYWTEMFLKLFVTTTPLVVSLYWLNRRHRKP